MGPPRRHEWAVSGRWARAPVRRRRRAMARARLGRPAGQRPWGGARSVAKAAARLRVGGDNGGSGGPPAVAVCHRGKRTVAAASGRPGGRYGGRPPEGGRWSMARGAATGGHGGWGGRPRAGGRRPRWLGRAGTPPAWRFRLPLPRARLAAVLPCCDAQAGRVPLRVVRGCCGRGRIGWVSRPGGLRRNARCVPCFGKPITARRWNSHPPSLRVPPSSIQASPLPSKPPQYKSIPSLQRRAKPRPPMHCHCLGSLLHPGDSGRSPRCCTCQACYAAAFVATLLAACRQYLAHLAVNASVRSGVSLCMGTGIMRSHACLRGRVTGTHLQAEPPRLSHRPSSHKATHLSGGHLHRRPPLWKGTPSNTAPRSSADAPLVQLGFDHPARVALALPPRPVARRGRAHTPVRRLVALLGVARAAGILARLDVAEARVLDRLGRGRRAALDKPAARARLDV